MSRKDSKGMFANVLGNLDNSPLETRPVEKTSSSPHLQKVAAGVRQIQERGELAERLLKDGGYVADLDPGQILPSGITDRFPGAYDEAAISDLAESMRERGQIVPGLVRPVKGDATRYQIVYGRRRLAAAKKLGLKFKAIIRALDDEEAIVFQGEENSARNDLTFIEKCNFAFAQEKAGFDRATISASLSTGKSHISEMIRIASTLPQNLLQAIGPASEIGRRRWLELVEKWIAFPRAHELVEELLKNADASLPSEERFALALSVMFEKPSGLQPKASARETIMSKGMKLAEISYGNSGARMSFAKSVPPDFVAYLAGQMETIHDAYLKEIKAKPKVQRS
ncbi:plasmid partitioning protein RepB (plasmid) [Hoeflea sp. IMCC20628]|uniref:plasmid partitioning protein RepB n=1 Tax=Hoeflea sp. IMCC20628 TaxID=1620421 RepID=UPI00063AC4F5|nr:plasmid partitioning protein RepB [Hoeflea sp. IMCC20628]AKI03518.1 plasmid partitioning protein RepB [Hoeflea sp. IMCC20628]